MKKTIAIMITGALVAATTVTAFAAQDTSKTTNNMIADAEARELSVTVNPVERPELPEGMEFAEGERPELPEGMEFAEGERPELPEGMEFAEGERPELPEGVKAGQYIPKLKPETKPEGEDMVPPEFEGIENNETLGKPEVPEEMFGQFGPGGQSRPGMMFGNETPDGEFAPNGEFAPDGEFGPGMQFEGEAPADMMF